jgi:hypothetical protein
MDERQRKLKGKRQKAKVKKSLRIRLSDRRVGVA